MTYTKKTGEFTRIGDTVHFTIDITLSEKGSSVGSAQVAGLPYAKKANATSACAIYMSAVTSGVGDTALLAQVGAGTTTINPRKMVTGTATILTDADFTNTTILRLDGSYKV